MTKTFTRRCIASARSIVSVALVASLTPALNRADAQTGSDQHGSEASVSVADSAGRALYLKLYCGLCHAFEKAKTGGIFGPTHEAMKEVAAHRLADPNYKANATTPEQYIRESIVDPTAYIVPGYETSVHRMPTYKHLSAEEIDALVTFLMGDSS